MLNVASGRPRTRQQAAIQESLTGRGRPRSRAWAWISLHTVAAWKVQGQTTTLAKNAPASAALWSPAMQVGPLGQFVDGDERGRKLLAGESAGEVSAGEVSGWLSCEDRGGDVGIDDDVTRARPARREA